MAQAQPGGTNTTIQRLIPKVQAALQNRQDATENQPNPEMRPSAWIRDTLIEISTNYPFDELRQPEPPLVTIGPALGFNGSNFQYLITSFLLSGDDYSLKVDPVILLTPSQAQTVSQIGLGTGLATSTVAYPMDYMEPKEMQTLIGVGGGIPFKYTRYGNQFWFGPQPGTNFQVYLPYQRRHPFDENLVNSPVYLPVDWFDIVAYAAAERGAIALRWNDQATFLHDRLYGDPDFQRSGGKEGRPGLIAARLMQQERDAMHSTRQIMPMVARY